MSDVKVLDEQDQVLFQCSLQDAQKAWNYARDMEAIGIEVRIVSPSLPESLAKSLGVNEEDLATLRHELEDELDSHVGCCNKQDQD
ncbi:MAG: hypothetical protein COW01_09375 [Bdellovibrionales bacterium CG12_big_fil_rev_8_21_14_0_65_38_15]|nr:MAG: hypothetical protein COW79_09380 [Bdellovibrionales bacterium CG22_combo_CG10-13_8_21_14_all_38_13]PIQ54738.1 MAG: hypothetical protein COW01_09375 [Bdellovibrionales bacterium CG12_big_fil_rev_8_21_14_0_65_38_15]PIR31293.1 MAG: hypothetical protein COV38_00990 [Bdellovibrionales bacterium CG11_big_fil_rev_8_21_14_0_20_38_13]